MSERPKPMKRLEFSHKPSSCELETFVLQSSVLRSWTYNSSVGGAGCRVTTSLSPTYASWQQQAEKWKYCLYQPTVTGDLTFRLICQSTPSLSSHERNSLFLIKVWRQIATSAARCSAHCHASCWPDHRKSADRSILLISLLYGQAASQWYAERPSEIATNWFVEEEAV